MAPVVIAWKKQDELLPPSIQHAVASTIEDDRYHMTVETELQAFVHHDTGEE